MVRARPGWGSTPVTTPGPLLEVTEGQLLEVHPRNANVLDGVTLHPHGVDVPNAADGVAGVTQEAVRPGEELTYRFVAKQAGSYWYHSHQVSHEQVIGGLLGPLVVRPRHRDAAGTDVMALLHTYDGTATINGRSSQTVDARPGQRVRLRVVNTDNGPTRAWAGTPYRVLAVDGHEVDRPTGVTSRATVVTAGGRVDIEVVAPRDGSGARVQVGSSTWVDVGGRAPTAMPPPPRQLLHLLSYGSPAPLGFDPSTAVRHVTYDIGRRPG